MSAVAEVWAWWEGCLLRAGGVRVAWVRGERGLGGVEVEVAIVASLVGVW